MGVLDLIKRKLEEKILGDFLLWFGGIVAFISIVGIFAAKKTKMKRRQYEQIAPQIGFKINPDRSGYLESPPQDLLDGFRRLPMGKYHTHSKSFSFILIKEGEERNKYIFDFWERKHSSSGVSAVTFTAFLMNSGKCNVPKFVIWPKTTKHLLQRFQSKDIHIESGEINKYHTLNGHDEEAIKKLFSQRRINAYFSQETGLYVEGSANTIACYRLGKDIPPHDLFSFDKMANDIFSLFEDAQ